MIIRRALLFFGILIVAILVMIAMVLMGSKPERQRPPAPVPMVTAYIVEHTDQLIEIKGYGSVRAKRSITLVPQVSGEVIEKSSDFEPGGYCTEGQVLLKIDDTDYALAFERATADVAQAEYNLARAEEEAQVATREWTQINGESGQPSDLVLHVPQLKLARATLSAAGAAVRQARVNLNRCTIKAAFDGRILTADVDAGQYLRAGTAVGALYATDIAEVTISVPDDDLAWISIDENSAPVRVSADFGGARHIWDGRAVRLGGAVDSRSRMVPVVVEITNPYQQSGSRPPLVEGMFVEVTFGGKMAAGSVAIPRSGLRPNNEVWTIDRDSKIRIREVEVSRAGVDVAVISDGLSVGEKICTNNLQIVTDGMAVRVEGDLVPVTKEDQ